MTQSGDPSWPPGDENVAAERINGILKTDFRLNRVFATFEEAAKAISKRIYNYNNLRTSYERPAATVAII